jgi:UDP-N-acetylglucosamine 3-dehydrogenase
MSDRPPVKIAIVSFAHMHAASYAQCLNDLAGIEYFGVFDEVKERAKQMSELHGVKAFRTYDELLASEVEGLIVCSENANHRKHVAQAAQNDKHVMCEKPLAASKQDADAIVEVCRRSQVKLQTAFPSRYHPAFKRLQTEVSKEHLGRILAIKATNQGKCPFGWFTNPKLSGCGAVIDDTVHCLDLIRCLTGQEAVRVYAEVDNRMFGKDFDDSGIITVEFTNKIFATIDCSWSRPKTAPVWGNLTMTVTGTEGVVSMDMLRQSIDYFSDKDGTYTQDYWGANTDMELVASFARAIANDEQPEISGADGAKAVYVAAAAYESAKTGQAIELADLI